MTSPAIFYQVIQIILQMWSCDQSLVTVDFYEKLYRNLNFIRIWPEKTLFFEGWSWFKFNNFGLALGTKLKFYTSVAKGFKLKVRKFLGLNPVFVEVTGEKLVGGFFALPILNRVSLRANFLFFIFYIHI